MARFTRKEYDQLGAAALKTVKELQPELNSKETQVLFGRLYHNIYRQNKLDKLNSEAAEKSNLKTNRPAKKTH